jgi:hypothetical protein
MEMTGEESNPRTFRGAPNPARNRVARYATEAAGWNR